MEILRNPGIILICNALLIGFLIYYAFSYLLSHLTFAKIQKPSQFIFKLIICTILLNFSIYLCYYLVLFCSYISILIRAAGSSILNTNISFSAFIEKVNQIFPMTSENFNLFSFDGMIRSLISVGFMNLAFTYSLRFIMIKVFSLISPFAILCLSIDNFSWIFKSWLKIYLSLLFLQILVSFILLIAFALQPYDNTALCYLLYLGTIYALIKSNSFMRDFMGGLTTDINLGISSIKSMFSKN